MTLSIFKRRNKVFYIASCKEKKFVTKLLFICKSVLSWPYQITISRLVIWKNSFSTLNFLLAGWLSCLQINRLEIKEEILNKAPPCLAWLLVIRHQFTAGMRATFFIRCIRSIWILCVPANILPVLGNTSNLSICKFEVWHFECWSRFLKNL